MVKIGFLVNPVAGMGGSVALKGTDGEETLRRARELGAVPVAGKRAAAAAAEFAPADGCLLLAPSGAMGEEPLAENGIRAAVIYKAAAETGPEDTKRAVQAMLDAQADLIVFTGGDGTARDVCSVVGDKVPVVGVPAGVKIHSGVYAKRPHDAGRLVKNFMLGEIGGYVLSEVEDLDEEAFREGKVKARLYGYMKVPDDRRLMQDRKSGGSGGDAAQTAELAAYVVSQMKKGELYLIGSGSTTDAVMKELGLKGTLLGVDAVEDGQLIGSDLREEQIFTLLSQRKADSCRLIITVIGGQGSLFGRGNQQLSPRIIRMVGKSGLTVIATSAKMAQLFGKPLTVDTGDASLDEELKGYVKVVTGYGRQLMAKIE